MKKIQLLSLILPAIILAGCNTNNPEGNVQQSPQNEALTQEGDQTTLANPDGDAQVVDYTVSMSNFEFSPNQLTAAPGQTIRVLLVNVDGIHDFVIDELGVQTSELTQDQEEVVEITIPEDAAGMTYEFYCSVGNHRDIGMVGTLTVTQ
jgi:plastocyanin